ncbi:hypothetical protein D9757_000886 [Collybiopsis confluens]|uniref:F-box domain-containing protein n=1 Tax=Collybiopsis confluens TaxID=2823264 RepID=A0A8H5I018_9AGAR|nr:hypothetical protein D9757_000886 [Collybiopsis confluens]
MATADNLHLDILELIFIYLSGNDLVSVALVSRAFFAGVIPRLYRKIMFRLNHAKRYPQLMSPFRAIIEHPALAVHVRHIEIRRIPPLKTQHHPVFLSEATQALSLCKNLQSFRCDKSALPSFLAPLQKKERLQELRVNAQLTTAQSEKLAKLDNLTSLCLDYGSWNIIDALPRWAPRFARTLTSLCLYSANELNEGVLDQVLQQLPGLQALHIVGCGQVDHVAVLRVVSHTPLLESLSFSTTESSSPLSKTAPSLPNLRHLALDTRYSMMSSPAPQVLASILNHLQSSAPALASFVLRLPEIKITVGKDFIEQLVKLHGSTLQTVAFIDCALSLDSILTITKSCICLERFELPIPLKDMISFASSIGKAPNLRLLIDTATQYGHSHGHGPSASLNQEHARYVIKSAPHLRKIVSGKRVWKNGSSGVGTLSLERLPAFSSGTYWFMPRDATDFGMN